MFLLLHVSCFYDPLLLALNHLPIGGPKGVEGVVAAEEEVVERNPLPASKCTHNKPLTPGSGATTGSPPKAPRALDGLSILYLRNSIKNRVAIIWKILPETRNSLTSGNSYSAHNINVFMQIFHSTLMVYNVYKGDQPILKFILMML